MVTIAGGNSPGKFECNPDYTIPRVYSGVSNDYRFINGNSEGKGWVFLDMPLSFVADTVVLPYTVYKQAKLGNLCTKNE